MNYNTKLAGGFMFLGASAYGIGNAFVGYLYPNMHTLQDLLSQLAILFFLCFGSMYYINYLKRGLK